jgi:hypothetical protein
MRMCRSVSEGVQAMGSASNRTEGRIAPLRTISGEGTARILPSVCSILASGATYGQVSKLVDSGHFFGPTLPWQQDGCPAETRNGQLRSARPDEMPRNAIATQHATADRTIPE